MKKKVFMKEAIQRLFSVVLALAMVVCLMPDLSMTVMAATCVTCNGEGRIYEDCHRCRNTGEMNCDTCQGSGNMRCDMCWGSGFSEFEECFLCNGSGYEHGDENTICFMCEGTGGARCNMCGGTGNMRCHRCDGTGKMICYICDGSGKEDIGECPQCGGTGDPEIGIENCALYYSSLSERWGNQLGGARINEGYNIGAGSKFVEYAGSVLYQDKIAKSNNNPISGRVVKIDGTTIYLCSNHTAEVGTLCSNCDPNAVVHTHGTWSYAVENTSTLKATCGNEGCDDTTYSVSLTLTASDAYSSGGVTLTGTEDWTQVFGTESVPAVYYEGTNYTKKTAVPTAPGVYKASVTVGEGNDAVTAETTYTVYSNTYTLTVPATAEAAGAGFNAVGDVNVKGSIASDKKIVVKASGSDNNTFKSTTTTTSVGYTIVKGDAEDYTAITESGLEFSQAEVNTDAGKSVAVGIVVNETDYTNAADGDYTTTVTWKAVLSSVE